MVLKDCQVSKVEWASEESAQDPPPDAASVIQTAHNGDSLETGSLARAGKAAARSPPGEFGWV